ncbi:MAG: TIM barrel protein [Patescibacteria group bacterium]
MTTLDMLDIGYFTASVQTPPGTNSDMFIRDPRKASMIAATKHLVHARKTGVTVLELGCALAPADANVPPESMADPVAKHTPIRTFRDGSGEEILKDDIKRLEDAAQGKVKIGSLGAFDNLLDLNLENRLQNIEHLRRAIRTAGALKKAGLGTKGVTIFIGRDLNLTIEQNMRLAGRVLIPLVRYAKAHRVKLFIENCPMCGWSSREVFTQNIANNPLHWIIIARMVEAAGLKGWCFLNYDASHDILQGMRPEWSFLVLKMAGYEWFIGRFHGKDLSRQDGLIAMSGFLGQRIAGDSGWSKMNGDQPAPGATQHNSLAIADGKQVDWLGGHIAIREYLSLVPSETTFSVEFEQSEFRKVSNFRSQQEHWDVSMIMLGGAIQFMRGIELAAAANWALRKTLLDHNSIEHPKTWSWQPVNRVSERALVGAERVIQQALSWKLPELPETSDLVLCE